MIRKTLVNVGVAALLGGMAVAAQAAGITLNLDFATKTLTDSGYVGGMTVGDPNTSNIAVGGLRGTGAVGSTSAFGTSFYTYCVQLTQNFAPGVNTSPYSYVGGASYFGSVLPPLPAASSVVGRLNKLFSFLDSPVPTSTLQSAAIQLAVWEAVYEGDTYGNVDRNALSGGGSFTAVNNSISSAAIAEANQILAGALLYDGPLRFTLGVLKHDGKQDFLVVDGGGFSSGFVPEPTSLALAFGALGALGFATRRRQGTKG